MEQKKFDVNSFIGMILLGGIIFWWMSTQEPEVDAANTITTTEIVGAPENINNTGIAVVNETAFENDSLKQVNLQNKLGAFAQSAINASEGVSVLENELVKLTIDNKGGQIIEALIKNYKTYDSLPLYMVKDNNASFNINFGTTDNRILNTKNLFFQPTITKNGDNQVVSMKLKVS
jgi:YidC/Oxa1 family membrane protein insertase